MGAGAETALYLGDKKGPRGTYLILSGDFRAAYEEAFPDKDACVAVYEKHKAEHRSVWSEDDDLPLEVGLEYIFGGGLVKDISRQHKRSLAYSDTEDNQ